MKLKIEYEKSRYPIIFAGILSIAFTIKAMTTTNNDEYIAIHETTKEAEESKAAFMKAYEVFMHPRCLNCHPKGDAPFQGDDSHIHTQNVKRGPDGKGLYAMKCANCHNHTNNPPPPGLPPGHPLWHLPPEDLKMIFEDKSPRELAQGFKDNSFTGFKNWAEDLIHHVEVEPLVINSWTYGTPPPYSHEEFVASVKEWIEKGAILPDE